MNHTKKIPTSVAKHLTAYHFDAFKPAWIELHEGTASVKATGGDWSNYFLSLPSPDTSITTYCDILEGMLPLEEPFNLPHMQLRDDAYTDILAFHEGASDWLIFFDVTESTLQFQRYQQVANELNLTKDQLNRTLGQFVGQEVAGRASSGKLQFNADGERRVITTLFVDIRGFTTFNEKVDAQEVMNTLNIYMNAMLQPILQNHGTVDKIIGDGIMAIFGITDSTNNHVEDAYHAGLAMQNNVKKLNIERKQQGLEALGIGVGIATGDAVLGVLGTHERRAFTAIGKHVNLAARLESNARAGEMLLDYKTWSSLSVKPDTTKIQLDLKGIGSTTSYSLII